MLTLNQWDRNAYFGYADANPSSHPRCTVQGPVFDEVYAGKYRALGVLIANRHTFVSQSAVADEYNGSRYPAGMISVSLPFALPYLSVRRPHRSLFGGHGWRSGNVDFDKHYCVLGRGRPGALADELLPALVPLIASRDDWTFAFAGPLLICVTKEAFAEPAEAQRTLAQVSELVSLLPAEAAARVGTIMPQGWPASWTRRPRSGNWAR